MLNQIVVVGRLAKDPEIKETENGKSVGYITLAVPRSYKNEKGEYEADYLDFVAFDGVATRTADYCKKGDIIGVKGRIQTNLYENEDGEKRKSTDMIAEKISFLSSKSKEFDEQEESKTEEQDLEV